jgi:hypothetical protein
MEAVFEVANADGSVKWFPALLTLTIKVLFCYVLIEKSQIMVLIVLLIKFSKLKNFSYPSYFQDQQAEREIIRKIQKRRRERRETDQSENY